MINNKSEIQYFGNKELLSVCSKLNAKNVYNVAEYSVSDYSREKKRLSKLLYRKE